MKTAALVLAALTVAISASAQSSASPPYVSVSYVEPTLAHLGETPPPDQETMKVEDFIARLRALAKDAPLSSRQDKPTDLVIAHKYFRDPPPSLREMEMTADAVVVGRIIAGTPNDAGFYHKTDRGIVTFYRVRISQVLRPPGGRALDVSPNELTVVSDGGSIDRGTKVDKLQVEDFPQLEVGHDYVLFLRWHDEHAAWTPAWGPHGTFEVIEGCIRSVGSARVAKEQDGLSIDRFITKLRALAKEPR